MLQRLIGFLALLAFTLPSAALAATLDVHCWCQQQTSQICNHNTRPFDTTLSVSDAFSDAHRTATCDVCRTYCAGLAGGPWNTSHCESGYREELCGECTADASSSCTAERGARVPTGSAGSTPTTTAAPTCPTPVQDVFPVHLGTPIGSVSEVNGLADYINVVYRYLVSIVLVVAIVMTVYGGFRYLFGASIGSVSAGKDIIRDALIGMLLVLGAYTILATINPATTILGLNPPEKIACRELDIPTALQGDRCNTDADCHDANSHCVETQFVFRTDTDVIVGSAIRTGSSIGGGAAGAIGAATHIPGAQTVGTWAGSILGGLGTAAGAGYYALFNIGGHVKACSDGTNGAPCDSSDDCRQGLYCLQNWNLCTLPSNLARGVPCGPLDRVAGATGVDRATCADGPDNCIRPAGTSGIVALAGGDYSVCRGSVDPMLTINDYVGNNSRVPNNYNCTTNQDCAPQLDGRITGMQCIGPSDPWRGKFCYFDTRVQSDLIDEADDSGHITARGFSGLGSTYGVLAEHTYAVQPGITPCVANSSGAVTPRLCGGGSLAQYTCKYCPSSGTRVWTYINDASGNGQSQIGVCDVASTLGTACSH
jgi:hypothetical protein